MCGKECTHSLRSTAAAVDVFRVWSIQTGEMVNTLIHHCEAVLHLRFSDGMMVTCSKVQTLITCCHNHGPNNFHDHLVSNHQFSFPVLFPVKVMMC